MKIKQAEIAFEMEKQNNEAQLKAMLMKQEFAYNQQLRGMSEEALSSREDAREMAKGARISQQNTEQSKLINQRKNNLPPQNFESNEDSLDGFDLAEFSPR
jgi:protein subunit release factor B